MSGPTLILRRRGLVIVRIKPGDSKLCGRAPTTDVTLDHPSVSRVHARISWPEGRPRPVIEDLQSVNGVWLNGRQIAQLAELKDGMTMELGCFELQVELSDDQAPALVDDGGTGKVRLFSEWGPELEGEVRTPEELRALLLDLDAERRTGTLVLKGQGQLTFACGRVVDATTPTASGMAAAQELVTAARPARYRFILDVTPSESDLNVSVPSFLEVTRPMMKRHGRDPRGIAL